MGDVIKLYHGSRIMVYEPIFGFGNLHNDYGRGFYCTKQLALAKEWACAERQGGYVNSYFFDMRALSVINLTSRKYNLLNWLGILMDNRIMKINNSNAQAGKDYLLSEFLPDYRDVDVIIGYRADNSYFSLVNAFLNNTLSLEQLKSATYLGMLGEQVVIRSQKAFDKMTFFDAVFFKKRICYPQMLKRDLDARKLMREHVQKINTKNNTFLSDIVTQGWKNNDPRL